MQPQQRSSSDDHWEVIGSYTDDNLNTPYLRDREQLPSSRPAATLIASRSSSLASLPPGASPPVPSPHIPRPASPFGLPNNTGAPPPSRAATQRERDAILRRRPVQHLSTAPGPGAPTSPPAVGILKALDPSLPTHELSFMKENKNSGPHSEESVGEERKERKGFWGGTREKEKEKDRDKDKGKEKREEDSQAELTKMIGAYYECPVGSVIEKLLYVDSGYLTATASEDWSLVLEVCDRASASEANAKEAVRALRREFKCV